MIRRRAPTRAEAHVALSSEPTEEVLAVGSITSATVDDAVIETLAESDYDIAGRVTAQALGVLHSGLTPILWLNRTPEVATLKPDGRVTRLQDGVARIEAHTRYAAATVTVPVERVIGGTTTRRTAWVDGSLAHAAATLADSLAGDAGPSDRWAATQDLSCISKQTPRATLVHPRVALGVEHYRPGTTLTFRGEDGVEHTRSVVARRDVGPPNRDDGYKTDLVALLLDADLPPSIRPADLPPAGLEGLLPNVTRGVAGLRTDQEGKHLGGRLTRLAGAVQWSAPPAGEPGASSYEPVVSGDSGSPAFLLLPEGPMLTTLWTAGGGGLGPRLHALLPEMQAAVNSAAAAAGVTLPPLSPADLSAYPSYA